MMCFMCWLCVDLALQFMCWLVLTPNIMDMRGHKYFSFLDFIIFLSIYNQNIFILSLEFKNDGQFLISFFFTARAFPLMTF